MLEHYVVFKPHPGRESDLAKALGDLSAGLADGIDGLSDLSWGENTNVSGLSRGYTHGCLGRFTDKAAFDRYWNHPAHERFMAALDDICAERFALDYTGG
ncbi:Dabb family protein [Streptomyces sp. NPDC046909]|uniref:Dabb family protein n=1 Tax=Streptomyces sp. NPDC046909 TaxID=3155617 RepID=UPI0033C89972